MNYIAFVNVDIYVQFLFTTLYYYNVLKVSSIGE